MNDFVHNLFLDCLYCLGMFKMYNKNQKPDVKLLQIYKNMV